MARTPTIESANAQERILEAALDVLAQHGYTGAGVQEIVEMSGTSKGSFYFHFPSKEKMVVALVDSMSQKLIDKTLNGIRHEPTPLHRVAAGIESLLSTFARQRKIAQVLLLNVLGHGKASDKKFLPMRERFSAFIKRELDDAVALGQIEPQDTELMAHIWFGALYEIIIHWLLTGRPTPLTKATPVLRTALLRSIGAEPALPVRGEGNRP